MVVDSSALAAVLFAEEDSDYFVESLAKNERKFISSVNYLEISIVVAARKGVAGTKALATLLVLAKIEVLPFDASMAEISLDAWRRFGKGRHRAALNLGDCAAYALAAVLNDQLLFKGTDFTQTDLACL